MPFFFLPFFIISDDHVTVKQLWHLPICFSVSDCEMQLQIEDKTWSRHFRTEIIFVSFQTEKKKRKNDRVL